MRTLSLAILIGTFFVAPAYATAVENPATDDQAKIEKLEREIKDLREELHHTRQQYSALQTRIDDIRSILGTTSSFGEAQQKEFGTQLCFDEISELRKTQIKLMNMGYKDEHPDAVNVTRALKKRLLECGIETADLKTSGN